MKNDSNIYENIKFIIHVNKKRNKYLKCKNIESIRKITKRYFKDSKIKESPDIKKIANSFFAYNLSIFIDIYNSKAIENKGKISFINFKSYFKEKMKNDYYILKWIDNIDDLERLFNVHIDEINNKNKISQEFNQPQNFKDQTISQVLATDEGLKSLKKERDKLQNKLEKEIINDQESIDVIRNILIGDDQNIEITDEIKIDEPWYNRIGLVANPFNKSGLMNIDEDKYESILIRNKGIDFANTFTNYYNDYLNQHWLICADFGNGKTCTIDYLEYKIAKKGVLTFNIRIKARQSAIEIYKIFLKELSSEVTRLYKKINFRNQSLAPDENSILLGIMEILEKYNYKGIIIFLEDLHKLFDKSLVNQFLSMLQPFVEDYIKTDIKVSLVGTAFPDWKGTMDGAVTSLFLDSNYITIPYISPEDAIKAVNNRFSVYAKGNKNNSLKYKSIISHFTKIDKDKDKNQGFRDYFNFLDLQFNKGEFDILKMNPTQFTSAHYKDANSIYIKHKSKTNLTCITSYLTKRIKKNKNKKSFYFENSIVELNYKINFLNSLLLRNEEITLDEMQNSNKDEKLIYFHLIKSNTIYQKYENVYIVHPHIQTLDAEMLLNVGSNLASFLKTKYKLDSLEEQTTSLISENPDLVEKEELNEKIKSLIDKNEYIDEKNKNDFYKNLDNINNEIYKVSCKKDGFENINIPHLDMLFSKFISLELINFHSKNFINSFSSSNIKDIITYYKVPGTKESFSSYNNEHSKNIESNNYDEKDKRLFIWNLDLAIYDYSKQLCKVIEFLNNHKCMSLDLINYSTIGTYFKKNANISAMITDYEINFRKFFFIITNLTFGERKSRKSIYNQDLRGDILNRLNSESLVITASNNNPNEFEEIQRKDFNNLLDVSNKTIFYKEVVKIFAQYDVDQIKEIITTLGDLNIKSSHNKTQWLKEKNSDLVSHNPIKISIILTDLIKYKIFQIPLIINERMVVFSDHIRTKKYNQIKEDSTLDMTNGDIEKFKKKGIIFWEITENHIQNFIQQFDPDNECIIDLLEFTELGSYTAYGHTIAILIYLVKNNRINIDRIYGNYYNLSSNN